MKILGVSSYHHDSAAASINDGRIQGASHEERFSRQKFDKSFPENTIKWMRDTYEDWEFAAFYEKSTYSQFKKDARKWTNARPVLVDHHEAHAMSSILMTDWTECAVMVIDTVGGNFATSLGVYRQGEIEWIKRFPYPNSLGLFYSSATRLLGFQPLSDECKIMSAAAYGTPKWESFIKDKIIHYEDGDYSLLHNLERGVGYGALDWDIAASVQRTFENIVVNLADWLYRESGYDKLAYAGGAALNCVANTQIRRFTAYNDISIQPAAGDAGCALGAAALIERPQWETAYLGIEATNYVTAEDAAKRIIEGEIVPIIQGKAEFGPRALGNRSLICIPTKKNIEKLNQMKGRKTDTWRPYALICQKEEQDKYFHIHKEDVNMLFVADIIYGNFKTHDMTARLQTVTGSSNPLLWSILEYTRQYGWPILLNTSMNAKGKPIINTLRDLHEIQLYD